MFRGIIQPTRQLSGCGMSSVTQAFRSSLRVNFRLGTSRNISTSARQESYQTSRRFSIGLGLLAGTSTFMLTHKSLANESLATDIVLGTPVDQPKEAYTGFKVDPKTGKKYRTGRFNGTLNYEQLTMGSFSGLFIGIVVGRLSNLLAALVVSAFMIAQFLHSRGIITMPVGRIVQIGARKIDLERLFFEQPSFKFSFLFAFVIAAFHTA